MQELNSQQEVIRFREIDILKNKNTFIFDWDDTVVEYNPTMLSLRAAQAVLMVLNDEYSLNIYPETLKNLEFKSIVNLIRIVSEKVYNDKHLILRSTYKFAVERDSARARADAIKELGDFKNKMKDFWLKFESTPDGNLSNNLKPLGLARGLNDFLGIALESGAQCFVISNSPRAMLQKSIDVLKADYGFDSESIFREIVCLRDLGIEFMKPNPQSMYNLINKHKLDKSRAIYIGNASEDVEFANNAEMSSIRIGQSYAQIKGHNHVTTKSFMEFINY